MAKTIISDHIEVVARFVAAANGMKQMPPCTTLGLLEDGDLIAGIAYTEYSKHNVFMHVAAVAGKRWMTRRFLHCAFHYPFVHMGVDRITGWVESSNTAARKFDEHLGFTLEGTLKGAARDGGDVLLYVLWGSECRFLGDRYAERRVREIARA